MTQSVLVIAGEASADMHGAAVVQQLNALRPDVEIFGIGGAAMRQAQFEAVAPAEDIAVAGLTEVLWALPRLWRLLRRLVALAEQRRPNVAVLIDLPDFNLRLARRLKKLGIPVLYYISPQVWAWRPKRVQQIRAVVDQMLVILPFEKTFYEQHKVPVQFVGHPLVDALPVSPNKDAARRALRLQGLQVLALLPGSRKAEVARHLPLMLQGVRRLQKDFPALHPVIPVASTVSRGVIEDLVRQAHVEATIVNGQATEVLCAADAAVVCSGTATLQAGLLARPMVIVYRVSFLTYHILKRLVRVAHIGLVNLVAGKRLFPELIQNAFTADNMAQALTPLLQNTTPLDAEFANLRQNLGQGGAAKRVTQAVLEYLR